MFRLILTLDGHIIEDYSLQDGDILTVGRSADNDIIINDEVVSFYHAYIVRLGDDLVLWGRDNGSGTVVNGEKVNSTYLKNGDILAIGGHYHLKTFIEDTQEQG
jgi:pSer/pThr/pTyr-binding forkhead associated (FHA) protein